MVNFALQAVWWGLGQAGAAYIRCFGQCLVSSAMEASIGVLWKYMMGDCEPGFEFLGMAVLAMQNCGYSCLNPRNWGGKRAKASTKSKAYEGRGNDFSRSSGSNRQFEPNPKHGKKKRGAANPEPTNPQKALDDSIELPGNTTRRISIDKETGEYVVFDEHLSGKFHGHTRSWNELDQKNAGYFT